MAVLSVVALVLAGCGAEESPRAAVDLPAAVQGDAVFAHLQQLDRIAKEHGGNRAAGTPGYDASLDYVVKTLRDKGFDVQTPEFEFQRFQVRAQSLAAGGRNLEVATLTYSPATPEGGITAPLVAVPPDDTPGCEAADYAGVTVRDGIALVKRGSCPFSQKQKVAAEQGARAVVVYNHEDGRPGGTLGAPGPIPAVAVSKADGEALAAQPQPVTLVVDSRTEKTMSRNVIAQTRTGATDNVVMVGAHLDSVPAGPGINDNGSGTAAVLETALQLGPAPQVRNAVRFAWWGAEELGLLGSEAYVEGLSAEARLDIALYLNFDMVGSPNPGYFSYDGDNSDAVGEPAGPQGSAEIEQVTNAYLEQIGVTPQGTDFSGRSDYGPFIARGIPSGGTDSGVEEKKTAAQVERWGGTEGEAFDKNYHAPGDTIDNINREALARHSRVVAYLTQRYSESTDGVPGRGERAAVRGSDR